MEQPISGAWSSFSIEPEYFEGRTWYICVGIQVTRGATLTTLYESLDANKTSLDFKTRRKFLCFPGPGSTTPLDVDGVMHYHTVENLQFFLNYNEGCQSGMHTAQLYELVALGALTQLTQRISLLRRCSSGGNRSI